MFCVPGKRQRISCRCFRSFIIRPFVIKYYCNQMIWKRRTDVLINDDFGATAAKSRILFLFCLFGRERAFPGGKRYENESRKLQKPVTVYERIANRKYIRTCFPFSSRYMSINLLANVRGREWVCFVCLLLSDIAVPADHLGRAQCGFRRIGLERLVNGRSF